MSTLSGEMSKLALVDDETSGESVGRAAATLSNGAFLDVEVCEVEGSNIVWVQMLSSADALQTLQDELGRRYPQGSIPADSLQRPDPAKLRSAMESYEDESQRPKLYVAAPYQVDGQYYRALVKARTSFTTCKVLFIDFGNDADVAMEALYALPAELRQNPAFAIRVHLPNPLPQPATEKPTPPWATKALTAATACLHVQNLRAEGPIKEVDGEVAIPTKEQPYAPIDNVLTQAHANRRR